MNVSELARQLKVHPQKLLQILPEFGFDIGARAVKVDDRVAEQIQREWRKMKYVLEERELKEKEKQKELEKVARRESGVSVSIPNVISVRELSAKLNLPINQLILELMKNGILATQNENIDHDTAVLLAQDLGFTVADAKADAEIVPSAHVKNLEEVLLGDAITPRPPVIVVMGHVDHGKTKLLDAIRSTNVVDQEAGGITQHIGAYQVVWTNPVSKEKNPLTFIDTPGHEAFTVMRSRGAKVADIAILVVAADDGVKPQTLEAISIIKAAKLPVVAAINKIDKPGADPQRVRTELSQHGIVPDDWGGDTPIVEISAKQKLNIDKLLDTLTVVADMNADKIKANPLRPAAGTVIEAHVDKGEGPVASILVQTGTLRVNDPLVVNGEIYGKVRAMKNYRGENIAAALPSCPVRVLGFKMAPQVGDILDLNQAGTATELDVKARRTQQFGSDRQRVKTESESGGEEVQKTLNLVIKADVLGSLEAILASLQKIKHAEVGVKVVGKGLGNITADDVSLAATAQAIIFGFNVVVTPVANEMIQTTGVQFHQYRIIYDLLDHVKDELEKLLNPELITTELGNAKILAIFRTEKNLMVAGARVERGKLYKESKARVKRNGEIIGAGKITKLQSAKQDMNEVPEGSECGLQFEGKLKLEVGDVIEAYKEEKKEKKLILV